MAFKLGDRARETSTAPGTGSFTVNGAVQGAQSLASVLTANGDTGWYAATNGTAWETGLLTRTSATVYARTTIYASSNAGSAVNFSSGTVDIFLDLPASALYGHSTIASATTTELGSALGQSIIVPGVVTITGFGSTAPVGAIKTVEFSGALILTYNATSLILPGAANITTVAGDTLLARHEGSGNWRVLGYTRGAGLNINKVTTQKFTSSGTYTPSAGMVYCIIECIGGGAGGGSAAGAVGAIYSGGGGGSGSYSRATKTAAQVGASQTVTIGAKGAGGAAGSNNGVAGGDTSVGALCIGKGGSGGFFGSAVQIGLGGAGGVAGTGDDAPAGAPGTPGLWAATAAASAGSGAGGSSALGGGGVGIGSAAGTATAGTAAGNYGSGGAGCYANQVAGNGAGGNGSDGYVRITEFCSQ